MGPAEALPSGVAATGVPCTHESPALQAQAGQLGPLPALPTLRLSQMQKQVLQTWQNVRARPMFMFSIFYLDADVHAHINVY